MNKKWHFREEAGTSCMGEDWKLKQGKWGNEHNEFSEG